MLKAGIRARYCSVAGVTCGNTADTMSEEVLDYLACHSLQGNHSSGSLTFKRAVCMHCRYLTPSDSIDIVAFGLCC